MTPSRKSFFALTAGDLMTPAVVILPEAMRLPAAARLLHGQQISGAPVVDREGRCTGVLSTTDFMRRTKDEANTPNHPGPYSHPLAMEWEMIESRTAPVEEVRTRMTADPVTVSPDVPAVALARMMLDAHIHRLIVVGAGRRPVGVVTTTDLLAALIQEESIH